MDYKSIYNTERQRRGVEPVKLYTTSEGPPHDQRFTGYFIWNGSSSSSLSSTSSQLNQSTSIAGKYRADLNTLKQNSVGHDFNYTVQFDERDYKGRKIFRAYALFNDGGKIENTGFYSNKKEAQDELARLILFIYTKDRQYTTPIPPLVTLEDINGSNFIKELKDYEAQNHRHEFGYTVSQTNNRKYKYNINPPDRPGGCEKEYNTYEEAEGEAAKRILYIYTNHPKYKGEDGPVIFSSSIIPETERTVIPPSSFQSIPSTTISQYGGAKVPIGNSISYSSSSSSSSSSSPLRPNSLGVSHSSYEPPLPQSQPLGGSANNRFINISQSMNNNMVNYQLPQQQQQQPPPPGYNNASPVPQFTSSMYQPPQYQTQSNHLPLPLEGLNSNSNIPTTGFRPTDSIPMSPIQPPIQQQIQQQSTRQYNPPIQQYQPPIQQTQQTRQSIPQYLPPIQQPIQQPIQYQPSVQQAIPANINSDDNDVVKPRSYQYEFYKQCIERNTIVVAPTGSGKTLVATLVIDHFIENNLNTNRLIVMLVPTTNLITQQGRSIDKYLRSKGRKVTVYQLTGKKSYDSYMWESYSNGIVICVPDVFEQALSHAALTIDRVALLIYDECHHGTKGHRYKVIQEAHYYRKYRELQMKGLSVEDIHKILPRIVGLTATPLKANVVKKDEIIKMVDDLTKVMDSEVAKLSAEAESELNEHTNKPREHIITYNKNTALDPLIETLESLKTAGDDKNNMRINDIIHCVYSIGPYWTLKAIKGFNIEDEMLYDTIDGELRCYCDDEGNDFQRCSIKLQRLIRLITEIFESDSQSKLILFVETRVETNELSKTLKIFIPTIKPVWLCGHGKSGSLITMTRAQQEDAIKQFERSCNVLISTQIGEEGLDIPKCNHVIRYDKIATPKSLIQSQGRARAMNSSFYYFVPNNEEGSGSISLFHMVEQISVDYIKNAEDEDEDDDEDSDLLESKYILIEESGALLGYHNSVSFLHEFVNRKGYKLEYKCKEKKEKEVSYVVWLEIKKEENGGMKYCYSVLSDEETSPKRAYANAAQKVYFKLYRDKKVTPFLFPKI